jgi:WhiB family transcriptional regulator, redox-sensing transcriptional regulator
MPSAETGTTLPLIPDPDATNGWMALGLCRMYAPATFFPSDGVGVEVAKRICETCAYKEPCLEYALAHRIDHGVWGGTSERQRRRILKKRKSGVTAVAAPLVSAPLPR